MSFVKKLSIIKPRKLEKDLDPERKVSCPFPAQLGRPGFEDVGTIRKPSFAAQKGRPGYGLIEHLADAVSG